MTPKTHYTFHSAKRVSYADLMVALVQYCYGHTTEEAHKWRCMDIIEQAYRGTVQGVRGPHDPRMI